MLVIVVICAVVLLVLGACYFAIIRKSEETGTIQCPNCKKEIQSGVKACPECGYTAKQYRADCAQASKPYRKMYIGTFFGFIAILIIAGSLITQCTHIENDSEEREAWVCAQNVVEQHLKSPSTADFCKYTEATITDLGNSKYKISGYVDSQNSFGAVVRSYFTVTLTLTGSGYKDAQCFMN